jgi:O-acetyl-ADP-ribose deacetylase (regulator of RNase III)
VTDAYGLDADYVIHAAAMPHYGDGRAAAESIRDATRNTLETADELGCESLMIPVLGCAVAGFDIEGRCPYHRRDDCGIRPRDAVRRAIYRLQG